MWDFILHRSFSKSHDTLVAARLMFCESPVWAYGYNKIIEIIMTCLTSRYGNIFGLNGQLKNSSFQIAIQHIWVHFFLSKIVFPMRIKHGMVGTWGLVNPTAHKNAKIMLISQCIYQQNNTSAIGKQWIKNHIDYREGNLHIYIEREMSSFRHHILTISPTVSLCIIEFYRVGDN